MHKISLSTTGRNMMIKIDDQVQKAVDVLKIQEGVVTVFCPHSSAGILINESDDPAVQKDIMHRLNDLVPLNLSYEHGEGNADAHIKSALTGSSVQVIVDGGKIQLGSWQGIYFCEFDGPREREIWVK